MAARATPTLPNDIATLQRLLLVQREQWLREQQTLLEEQQAMQQRLQSQYEEQLQDKQRYIDYLLEQFVLLRHQRFGIRSEKIAGQRGLFEEAEALVAADAQEAAQTESARSTPTTPRARGGRKPLPADLPRVDVIHELPRAQQHCDCGAQKKVIGEDTSEQLDIVPMQVRVIRHVRHKYACPCCEAAPVTAPLPAQPIPKSNAAPGLLAMLLTAKYVDGLPLHRFERVLARSGVDIPRQTLARWVIGSSALLQPLHNLLRDQLLAGPVIHCDETAVQVLKEPDRSAQSQSYMWVQAGGARDGPVILFDYHPSRSSRVPLQLLQGYAGPVMTDGYEGYHALEAQPGVIRLCCWAHARRKFIEAQRAQPKEAKMRTGKVDVALHFIGKLYGIERSLKDADVEARYKARQAQSVPVLNELRAWLDKALHSVPPRGKLGEALAYLHKYWERLTRYIERGDLPIDNNRAENAIRPFVIGRKNWLFSDTPRGADASALIYSVIETAKANGLEPYSYLRHVLRELPQANTVEQIEALLPWNLQQIDLLTELEP